MINQIKPKEKNALQKAQLLLSQNDAESAKNVLLQYTKKHKSSPVTRYLLSMSHAILGETREALKLAETLAKEQAKNIEYLKLLGSIYHNLKEYSKAIHIFERALQINSQDFQSLANLASALKETNQYDDAEFYFNKSLAINPNQPDALTNYGILMQANAKIDKAIELHKKALQISPQDINALYNLAFALNEKNDNEEALRTYSKLIKIMPNHTKALCDIAYIYIKLKQAEKSLDFLERAKQINPNDEQIHINSSLAHKMLGNINEAENSLNEALRINPDNQTALYQLAIIKSDNAMTSSPDKYVEELFDGYAESFDDHLIGQLQYKTPELISDMVKKHSSNMQKHKILDLGCGTGLAGTYLTNISEHMVGVDLSSKMLKKAAERNIYDELITSGISQYFETSDFQPSLIISADVFVYIGDLSGIFKDAYKALQENGLFVFSTEDYQGTEGFILKESGRFAHNENYIRSLAESTSLNLIDSEKTIIRYEASEAIHGQVYLLKK